MKLDELRRRSAQSQADKKGKTGLTPQAIQIHANHAQQRITMLFTNATDNIVMNLEQAAAHGITVLAAAIGYGAKFSGDPMDELEEQIKRAREICAREIELTKKH